MKEITIAVPDGKEAIWAEDGKLALVDATPATAQPEAETDNRPVTERVKTFEDAMNELNRRAEQGDETAGNLLVDYDSNKDNITTKEIVAFMQLAIITAALNEGWEPQFTEDEYRWYPWYYLWTKEELAKKSDEWKDKYQLLLWGGHANYGAICRLAFSNSNNAFSGAYTIFGSRLAYKTEALSNYSAQTFNTIWCQFLTGKEGTPWRNS